MTQEQDRKSAEGQERTGQDRSIIKREEGVNTGVNRLQKERSRVKEQMKTRKDSARGSDRKEAGERGE